MWQFSSKSEKKFFDNFQNNQGKNENEDEKKWKNKPDFLILHIKIKLSGNFHENLRQKVLTHFLRHF